MPENSIIIDIPLLTSNAKPLELALIPAGSFTMGSPDHEKDRRNDEGPVHQVTITKPFYLGKFPITQIQWQTVMGNNPSLFQGMNRPVTRISWDHCQTFIHKINQKGAGIFRLPTEAEWEYACRAGTSTRFYWGDDADCREIDLNAWYSNNSGGTPHEVGLKKPNPWGLFDMSGNVCEWCQDWKGDYPSADVVDPQGPDSGEFHVIRGGAFGYYSGDCRSAIRCFGRPAYLFYGNSFRLVKMA